MIIETVIDQQFIDQRNVKLETYSRGKRSEKQHLIDLDCEIVEYELINNGNWFEHPTWQVDAISPVGHNVDFKFVNKYWNISKQRVSNIMRQYGIIHYYSLFEWVSKPVRRPLEVGDVVSYRQLGTLSYETVMQHIIASKKDPGGFYIDARKLLDA